MECDSHRQVCTAGQDPAYADALDRIEQAARSYPADLKAVRNAADC